MPTETSKKRPAPSGDDNTASERPWKRRSTKACLSCRNRKVRCDVVTNAVPCTNCRLDSVSCVLKESNRGRKPGSGAAAAKRASIAVPNCSSQTETVQAREITPSLPTLPEQSQRSNSPHIPSSSPGQRSEVLASPPAPLQHSCASPANRSSNAEASIPKDCTPPTGHTADEFQAETFNQNLYTPPASVGQLSLHSTTVPEFPGEGNATRSHGRHGECHLTTGLPLYLRPIPRTLDGQDIEYLSRKGCLTIPAHDFRDELLRTYINIVHPFLPAIDLDTTICPILHNDGRNPLSLLLFQAIMFASVTFVDMKYLRAEGYTSRKAARKDFFNRVHILYSLNWETDRISLMQTLLLMTYWHDGPDHEKDTWYWMGITLHTAHVVGLHRTPDNLRISAREKKLRRRIWWCCVMRDRLLALGLRCPARIRDDEYDVAPLTVDDFDQEPPSTTLTNLLNNSDTRFQYLDAKERSELVAMCIELSKLSLAVGLVLQTLYTVMGSYHGGSEYIRRPFVRQGQTNVLIKCGIHLHTWKESLDDNLRFHVGQRDSDAKTSTKCIDIHRVHRAQLHMVYLATLGALHRPHVVCNGSEENVDIIPKEASRDSTDTAVEMTKLAFDLQRNNELRFLPTVAVPTYLSVTLILLMKTRQSDEELRNLSLGRLYQCVGVLQQLQNTYSSADYAIQFMKAVLNNTGLHVPMLTIDGHGAKDRRSDGAKNHYKTTHRATLDMGPSHVAAACMYPSPSPSGQFDSVSAINTDETSTMLEFENLQQTHPQIQQMLPPQLPLSGIPEAWIPENGYLEEMQATSDLVSGSPYPASWWDLNIMGPAMISFESENGIPNDGEAPLSKIL